MNNIDNNISHFYARISSEKKKEGENNCFQQEFCNQSKFVVFLYLTSNIQWIRMSVS